MKILNFGSCNIDMVYSMDHIVLPGETQTSERVDRYAQRPEAVPMRYVYQIKRDALMNDLFQKLSK